MGSESSRRSTSNDAERLAAAAADQTSHGYSSAAEKYLTESQRRLRNILNDSTPRYNTSSSKTSAAAAPLKPIIQKTDDATRGISKMRLNDTESSDTDAFSTSTNDKKAVYFNDNVDYRSPPSLANDD